MLFVGDLGNKELSESIGKSLDAEVLYLEKHIFDDGEQRLRLLKSVLDAEVFVLKSLSPPVDSNLIEFLFTIDALKRSGARKITAILPYIGYSRADHVFREGEAVPLEVVINCLEANGLDEVIVIDPHTIKIAEMFRIPSVMETALPVFAEQIKEMGYDNSEVSIVSPDMGGIRRVKQLVELLPGSTYAAVNKDRDLESGSIESTHIAEGEIRDICFITDDIISTGGTMVKAASLVKKEGAKKVYIFASQPVFSADAPSKLQNSQVEKVFVTDAIPVANDKRFEKLTVLSLGSYLAGHIA